MSHFAQHYARLRDEDLMDLALRDDLVSDARSALNAELANRGIINLAPHAAARHQEARASEEHRQVLIAGRMKTVRSGTKTLLGIATLTIGYGVYRTFVPNIGENGGGLVAIGIVVSLFALLSSWISRLWIERVLHRRPPR